MATIDSNNNKYSLKFVSTSGQESTLRTIAGLNAYAGTGPSTTGPYAEATIGRFFANFVNFTDSNLSDVRWINERQVTL